MTSESRLGGEENTIDLFARGHQHKKKEHFIVKKNANGEPVEKLIGVTLPGAEVTHGVPVVDANDSVDSEDDAESPIVDGAYILTITGKQAKDWKVVEMFMRHGEEQYQFTPERRFSERSPVNQ